MVFIFTGWLTVYRSKDGSERLCAGRLQNFGQRTGNRWQRHLHQKEPRCKKMFPIHHNSTRTTKWNKWKTVFGPCASGECVPGEPVVEPEPEPEPEPQVPQPPLIKNTWTVTRQRVDGMHLLDDGDRDNVYAEAYMF